MKLKCFEWQRSDLRNERGRHFKVEQSWFALESGREGRPRCPEEVGLLRAAIMAVRKGGRVSVPGVFGGMLDKFPLGAMMEKGITIKTGQTHVQKYTHMLLEKIQAGEIDTTFLISHRLSLEEAPMGYKNFRDNQNEWTKVVLRPS